MKTHSFSMPVGNGSFSSYSGNSSLALTIMMAFFFRAAGAGTEAEMVMLSDPTCCTNRKEPAGSMNSRMAVLNKR